MPMKKGVRTPLTLYSAKAEPRASAARPTSL
jgi:hypothetical protein